VLGLQLRKILGISQHGVILAVPKQYAASCKFYKFYLSVRKPISPTYIVGFPTLNIVDKACEILLRD